MESAERKNQRYKTYESFLFRVYNDDSVLRPFGSCRRRSGTEINSARSTATTFGAHSDGSYQDHEPANDEQERAKIHFESFWLATKKLR